MKFAFSNRLTACFAAVGLLTITPAAFGQTAKSEIQAGAIEHLTCVKDAQGLVCKTQTQTRPSALEAETPTLSVAAPNLISSVELELFSNILLGVLYFLLPAGLGLAILSHDKRDAERSKRLNAQIELLERLWNQHPQH